MCFFSLVSIVSSGFRYAEVSGLSASRCTTEFRPPVTHLGVRRSLVVSFTSMEGTIDVENDEHDDSVAWIGMRQSLGFIFPEVPLVSSAYSSALNPSRTWIQLCVRWVERED